MKNWFPSRAYSLCRDHTEDHVLVSLAVSVGLKVVATELYVAAASAASAAFAYTPRSGSLPEVIATQS